MRKILTAVLILAAAGVLYVALNRAPHIDILGTETKLYSQFDEEVIIRDFFQDRRNGFYLDVGCASPHKISTTHYLDHHLGWTGIGVDALKEYGPQWRRRRPNSKFFSYLVTDHSDSSETFYQSPVKGLSSTNEELASGQRFRPDQPPMEPTEIEIPTITMTELLDRQGVTKIDFLSMDIEGHEPKALAGFDIERFAPELVCIESGLNRDEILEYFDAHGYERIERYLEYDHVNWYFAPRPSRLEALWARLTNRS